MSATRIALAAALGSAALLLGAFAFQYLGGLAPCRLCIWQRWPHGLALAVGLLLLLRPDRRLMLLGGLIVLSGAGIAFYHGGVEQGWWQGPDSCSAGGVGGLDAEALMARIMAAPLVRCTDIPWSLFGLSMAAWNGILSLGLAGLWLTALRRA